MWGPVRQLTELEGVINRQAALGFDYHHHHRRIGRQIGGVADLDQPRWSSSGSAGPLGARLAAAGFARCDDHDPGRSRSGRADRHGCAARRVRAGADAIPSSTGVPTLTEITGIFGVSFPATPVLAAETARWIADEMAARGAEFTAS